MTHIEDIIGTMAPCLSAVAARLKQPGEWHEDLVHELRSDLFLELAKCSDQGPPHAIVARTVLRRLEAQRIRRIQVERRRRARLEHIGRAAGLRAAVQGPEVGETWCSEVKQLACKWRNTLGSTVDLALHLICAHHGHARPTMPVVLDDAAPGVQVGVVSLDTTQRKSLPSAHQFDSGVGDRFEALMARFGWWGLAYLEAVLRLADAAASVDEARRSQDASEAAENGQDSAALVETSR